MPTEIIVAIILGAATVIPAILQLRVQSKKVEAEERVSDGDEAAKLSEAWAKFNAPVMARLAKLEQQVEELEGQKKSLEEANVVKDKRIAELESKVESQELEIQKLRQELEQMRNNEVPSD